MEDLEELKNEMGDRMWWIPRSETNPRWFGINKHAVKALIEKAKRKDNFVTVNYQHINTDTIRGKYWKMWYNLLKRLSSEG